MLLFCFTESMNKCWCFAEWDVSVQFVYEGLHVAHYAYIISTYDGALSLVIFSHNSCIKW